MHKVAQFILIIGAIAALSACQRERPASIPPSAPTVAVNVTPPPTAIPAAATSITGAALLTPTVVVTATATVTPTVALEAVAQQALRIRGGPGLEYPIVGDLAATGRVTVIGRSADGAWLQIECPPGVASDPCWIIGDPAYWQFDEVAAVLPTAPAPPVPAPSPTATPPPCVVSPPAGWTVYTIVSGDTLSGLAGRFGVSVAQLQSVNCLPSDAIKAGGSLWAPGGGASGVATSAPGSSSPGTVLSMGAVSSIMFKDPGRTSAGCWTNDFVSDDPSQDLTIDSSGEADFDFKDTFIVTDWVCVFVSNRDPNRSVDVRMIRPGHPDLVLSAPQNDENAWSFLLTPGSALLPEETSAVWTVIASQPATDGDAGSERKADPVEITVARATGPLIRVVTPSVAVGGKVEAVSAGFPPNSRTALYLYRLDVPSKEWRLVLERALPDLVSDANGEATYGVTARPQDAGGCFLLHTGKEDLGGASNIDARVFAVGVSPKACQ